MNIRTLNKRIAPAVATKGRKSSMSLAEDKAYYLERARFPEKELGAVAIPNIHHFSRAQLKAIVDAYECLEKHFTNGGKNQ